MIEAKKKAIELVDKYRTYIRQADKYSEIVSEDEIYLAKKCALVAVDEMIELNGELWLLGMAKDLYVKHNSYLFELKEEIEKL